MPNSTMFSETQGEWVFQNSVGIVSWREEIKLSLISAGTCGLLMFWFFRLPEYTALAVICGGMLYAFVRLPLFRGNVIREIRVTLEGIFVGTRKREDFYPWSGIEAASFDDYLPLLRLQVGNRRIEISLHPFDKETQRKIYAVLKDRFDGHSDNNTTPIKPCPGDSSFYLAAGGIALSLLSFVGLIAGLFLLKHAFAIILSCAFWFTGSCLGVLSIHHRISQWSLILTVLAIVLSWLAINQSGVDVAEFLRNL